MSTTPTEVSVNGALLGAFRHNSWATRQLLAFCRHLPGEQQAASATGPLWERLLSEPVDAERVVVVDDGALEVRAGVIVAQALHHGNPSSHGSPRTSRSSAAAADGRLRTETHWRSLSRRLPGEATAPPPGSGVQPGGT